MSDSTTNKPRIGTVDQLAAELNVNKFTVYRAIEENRIPHYRVGNRTIRIDLDRALAAMYREGK